MNKTDDLTKIVLVLSVGTTSDPVKQAIEEACTEGELHVYLIYGRQLQKQDNAPFDIATKIKQGCISKTKSIRIAEISDPEDFDGCLKEIDKILLDVVSIAPDKTIINFTGGTKVMSSALVHSALKTISGNLYLEYIGGKQRNSYGRVSGIMERRQYTTFFEEQVNKILSYLRVFNYAPALALCDMLPQGTRAEFVTKSVRGLWLWDNFHYGESFNLIKDLKEARWLADEQVYSRLADTILRLIKHGSKVDSIVHDMTKLEGNTERPVSVSKRWGNDLLYIVADSLENAQRRLSERRFVDAVLRSYRSVESAIQISLIKNGINPWGIQWNQLPGSVVEEYKQASNREHLPYELSLFSGFKLLATLCHSFDSEVEAKLKDLMYSRNHSYLEHGYTEIKEPVASKVFTNAAYICDAILNKCGFPDSKLAIYRKSVSHSF